MNLNHKSNKVFICGASGTGKTTYLARYILSMAKEAQIFIYDHQGDIAPRLGVNSIEDYDGLTEAIKRRDKIICFDPATLYAGELKEGFDFFCDYVYTAGSWQQGRKIFICDEIHLVTSTDESGLPWMFNAMNETGRKQEIDLALISQQVNLVNNRIRFQATEVVCFQIAALDTITKNFLVNQRCFVEKEICQLPEGSYVARNSRTGQEARGQLWKNKKPVDNLPRRDIVPSSQNAPPSETVIEEVT